MKRLSEIETLSSQEHVLMWEAAQRETISKVVFGHCVESTNRLDVLLALAQHKSARVFWPCFHEAWPSCDLTGYLQRWLFNVLYHHNEKEPGIAFLNAENRAFLDSLPDPIPVIRGGGRARIESVSWTTSRETAEVFARGYRGARVRKPVIATGLIPKRGVFGAYVDRKESEILLNPLWLRDVSHVPYKAPDSKR